MVTLVEQPGAVTWGVAYRMEHGVAEEILARLDIREKNGYLRYSVQLLLEGQHPQPALAYVAREYNPDFLGPAPLPDLARQILDAAGPSGPNPDYVLRLAESLRELQVEDDHVFELERWLRT